MTVRTVLAAALLAALLGACGDPAVTELAGSDPGATDPGASTDAPVVAPDCDELRAPWLARGVPRDGATIPATPVPAPYDIEEVVHWARQEGGDDYAGAWVDPPGSFDLTIAFVGDVEAYRSALHERFGEGVRVVAAERSLAELRRLQAEVDEDMRTQARDPERDRYRPRPGTIIGTGSSETIGRVSVMVVGGDDTALAEVTARYGADRICLEVVVPPPPMDPDGPVRALAKVEGWRGGLDTEAYALAEVAYDAETAERAWRENVPGGLPGHDPEGDPIDAGLYGSLDDIDFSTHVLVVWSAGESGSCPGWLADIRVVDGEVRVERGAAGVGVCTDDYNPYRMVLAVERDRVPAAADLPREAREGDFVTAVVTAYP